jgi:phosphoribosylformylglycinamidine synthase subunit PurSL
MIYRIDVWTRTHGPDDSDPAGEAVRKQIAELGKSVGPIKTCRIFFLDTDASPADVQRIAGELLADPVVERAELVHIAPAEPGRSRIEIHLKPGVMDPVAASTEMAIRDMGLPIREVRTGRAYVIDGIVSQQDLQFIANRILANSVIETILFAPLIVKEFPHAPAHDQNVRHVEVRNLTDDQLNKLSREGHLFLSLAEMKAIQDYYRNIGREPTDIELETLAQTWSEHCVHKTLKSGVDLEIRDESGKVLATRKYRNLIKETVFRSTMELMEEAQLRPASATQHSALSTQHSAPEPDGIAADFCLSVFADNAGVISFDEADAVCFKVETHNRPSAIDPYGGSATGSGGVIRDVLGTGLAARPIANTDVFCVADPNFATDRPSLAGKVGGYAHPISNLKSEISNLPKGVIHPKRILREVVAGVRDYGNRMGIPTLNGAVYFDNRYLGNPLVFCGCVGLIPRGRIIKNAQAGDKIVVMGGRTGRDGIHGATFSSAELTTSHADEFSHAVQIGNAITEKKMTDVVLQAAERGLFSAITDCGAGGLSSAVGEMGEKLGALVELDRVPLKYAGLKYDEIWISEAQERMVLAVSPEDVDEVLKLAAGENVEATVIGEFGTPEDKNGGMNPTLRLKYNGVEVGRMDMEFVHKGIPMPVRKAVFVQKKNPARGAAAPVPTGKPLREQLLAVLSHPNVASKHWIVRQYDHEVQGGSAVKPLLGPAQVGPSDASVIRPKLTSRKGVVLSCGLAPHIEDSYDMAVAGIDEAVRNAVAVGADPNRLAILDNFCWPGTHDEVSMGHLARTCEACYDAAKAYGVPFISGKDSLHNQFTNQETGQVIRIPNTLLISAIGVIDDVRKCVTMDFKSPGNLLLLVACKNDRDLKILARMHRLMAQAIAAGHVRSCHDVSDGGWLTAAAEMSLASGIGIDLHPGVPSPFDEQNGAYLVETAREFQPPLDKLFAGVANVRPVGRTTGSPALSLADCRLSIDEMRRAWLGTLDW